MLLRASGIDGHRLTLPCNGQHRLGSDVEPRSQDHRHGALRPLRSGASRDGPASGGPDTRHAGTYPRSADEDGLESGIGRAPPTNSRASPLCMGSPRGGSMNDEPPVRKKSRRQPMERTAPCRHRTATTVLAKLTSAGVSGRSRHSCRSRETMRAGMTQRLPGVCHCGRRGVGNAAPSMDFSLREKAPCMARVPQCTGPAIGAASARTDGSEAPPVAIGAKPATGYAWRRCADRRCAG